MMAASTLLLTLLAGCSALRPLILPAPHPNYYSLSYSTDTANPATSRSREPASTVTLVVSPPHAAAGFDSQRMMYMRHADQLEYFAYNEWIDTPARMLAPLIVAAVANSGAFRAVVETPSPASGELRLDSEIVRLQQEFATTPGRVRFTLRAYLIEVSSRRVVATREFDAVVATASEDPQGGVTAANRAVQTVLDMLAAFCADGVRGLAKANAPTRAPSTP